MRSIKVIFAALALSAATTAFAAAGPATQIVSLNNGMSDSIATDGTVSVSFSAIGAGAISGNPTLAYSTDSNENAGTAELTSRKVMVATTLPAGVTGKVTFAVGSTGADPNGVVADNGATLGAATALVTAIPRFITQAPAALTYTFEASKGFATGNIIVTYTLADE